VQPRDVQLQGVSAEEEEKYAASRFSPLTIDPETNSTGHGFPSQHPVSVLLQWAALRLLYWAALRTLRN